MEIHLGASSFISENISFNKNLVYKISSKKKKNFIKVNYNNLHFLNKILLENKIDYIIFFLGKNLKGKNLKKSYYLNYSLPLKILNFLIHNNNHKVYKFIFFGTFLEDENKTSNENLDYKKHKIKFRKKVVALSKKKLFDFVWIKLPLVYGKNMSNSSFAGSLIVKLKSKKDIIINFKYNTIHLINVLDIKTIVSVIKKNWNKYKNKIIIPKTEGPYFIYELMDRIKKIIKYDNKIIYINSIKKNKINLKTKLKSFKISRNFINFLKKNV